MMGLTLDGSTQAMPSSVKTKERKMTVGERRRNALIEATIQSLAEHGIAGTTISTICEEAGSSRGLISHYFDSKEALLAAALRQLYDSVSTPIGEELSNPKLLPTERLKRLPELLFSKRIFTERNRNAFLSLWHETRYNDILRETNRELYSGYLKRMENLFAKAANEQGKTIDAHEAAVGFIGLSDGIWLGLSIDHKLVSRRQAVTTCIRYIDRELAA